MSRMRIFIDGEELENWMSASLSRKKKDLTGELSVEIFFNYVPSSPVLVSAMYGNDVVVYIDNQIAFYGIIDARLGTSVKRKPGTDSEMTGQTKPNKRGVGLQTSIGDSGYKVTLNARGRTKYLIDSSHTHDTGTFSKITDKKAIEQLVSNYNIDIDWQADEIDFDRFVLRDGSVVVDEIFRICNESCHFVYETRDGKLRIQDQPSAELGEPLILGQNFLSFNTMQSEDRSNSSVTVKGHRNKKGVWGKDAIVETKINVKNSTIFSQIPLTVQHYGDATPERLERRGKWELDKRASESKNVQITVFGISSRDGIPWDIGLMHYVEVPPEGIATNMECIELKYSVDADGTLQTELLLAPPPTKSVSSMAVGDNKLTGTPDRQSENRPGLTQYNPAGTSNAFPSPWSPGEYTLGDTVAPSFQNYQSSLLSDAPINRDPPSTIPRN